MSQSRLSIARYGAPAVYHARASDLFAHRNEILNPDETLPKMLSDFKRLFEQTQDSSNCMHDTIITCDSSKTEPVYVQRQLLIARSAYFENLMLNKDESEDYKLEENSEGNLIFI